MLTEALDWRRGMALSPDGSGAGALNGDPAPAPAGGDPTPAGAAAPADGKPAGDAPAGDPAPAAAGDPPASPQDWPDDWRAKLSGDDEKLGKRLERFRSPRDILDAWRAAEAKISSGEMKAALPKDATEEQVAAWRKENGIPEDPKGYLDALPDGLVLGEDMKARAEGFAAKMHELNAPPELVGAALAYNQSMQEEMAAERAEQDRAFKAAAEDALRKEWGAEYRANVRALQSMLDATNVVDGDQNLKELLLGARLADGSVLGDNPLALRWLSRISSEINPAGTVVPNAAGDQASAISDEIASIENRMRTDRSGYNKDEAMQARYRQLLEAREKLNARAA